MPTGSWYEDPARPDCDHAATEGSVLDLFGDGEVPAERCLGCRAVRSLVPRVEMTVVWRATPLAFNKAAFPEKASEPVRAGWRRPSFVPEDWWNGSPPKRHA